MNKTQKTFTAIVNELTKHCDPRDAEYFAQWLVSNYKLKEYTDVADLNTNNTKK